VNLAEFAASVNGEVVAGCVIATIDGKRQYLYQRGEFTPRGREMYNQWTHQPEPEMAIAIPEPEPRPKLHKSRR
jgi:hypothetical protein